MTEPNPPACDCACKDPAHLADAVEATIKTLLDEGRLHGVIVRDERRGRPPNPTPRGA
jgi:hypothetical protein